MYIQLLTRLLYGVFVMRNMYFLMYYLLIFCLFMYGYTWVVCVILDVDFNV